MKDFIVNGVKTAVVCTVFGLVLLGVGKATNTPLVTLFAAASSGWVISDIHKSFSEKEADK